MSNVKNVDERTLLISQLHHQQQQHHQLVQIIIIVKQRLQQGIIEYLIVKLFKTSIERLMLNNNTNANNGPLRVLFD